MTWREANLSLQLETEVRVGAVMRLMADLARAREDAAFDALRGQLGDADASR